MLESLTPGARRALERAADRARRQGSMAVEPIDLLAALADEAESRAADLMRRFGLEPNRLFEMLGTTPWRESDSTSSAVEQAGVMNPVHSSELRSVLGDASIQARSGDRNQAIGTEHLLGGLLSTPGPASEILNEAGLAREPLIEHLGAAVGVNFAPIPIADDIPPLDLAGPGEATDLARILDAAANRAREGLRVVEDYIRFVLDDPMLASASKEVRHRFGEAVRGLDLESRIGARDTIGDVGTHLTTTTEQVRENPRAVLSANFKRVAEALRSLEEYSKLIDVWLSGRFEVLRYDTYTLEKLTLTAVARAPGDRRRPALRARRWTSDPRRSDLGGG